MSLFVVGFCVGAVVMLIALLAVAVITEPSEDTHERGEDGL